MAPKAARSEPGDIGDFVRTQLGIGRLVAIEGSTAHVRYFQGPGRAPYVERTHPIGEVVSSKLPVHARAYLYDGRRWRIGRLEGTHPQDPTRHLVAFPNLVGA